MPETPEGTSKGIPEIFFDYFNLVDIPTFILCNPNREQLFALGGISERVYSAKFNALSELSFRADEYVDKIYMPYYEYLVYKRLVYIDTIGYFIITNVSETNDGIVKYKEVTCESLETILNNKRLVVYTSGSTSTLAPVKLHDLLLDLEKKYMPDWTHGQVPGMVNPPVYAPPVFEEGIWGGGHYVGGKSEENDTGIASHYRSFDISDKTIYDFLMTEVEEAYGCVFDFDTINQIINIYDPAVSIGETDIYLSYDNLVKQLTVEQVVDEMATVLNVHGGNGLDILYANPLGTNDIYNFTYFKNSTWMDTSLIASIDAWEQKVYFQEMGGPGAPKNTYRTHALALLELGAVSASQSTVLNYYTGCLAYLEQIQASCIEAYNLYPTSDNQQSVYDINQKVLATSSSLVSASAALQQTEDNMNEETESLKLIAEDLSISGSVNVNFTNEQMKQLQPFILQSSYVNDNIIITDSMSASTVMEQSQKLYLQAKDILTKTSIPKYTFEVDSVNFLQIKEFYEFRKQLSLGASITLEINNTTSVSPILLGMDINFDNPEDFSLTFGNRMRMDDESYKFTDLMGRALEAGNTNILNSYQWSDWSNNYRNKVGTFIDSEINAANNQIVSGSEMQIIINPAGLKTRRRKADGTYEPDQLWIINGTIYKTSDGWNTVESLIGGVQGTIEQISADGMRTEPISISGYGLSSTAVVGEVTATNVSSSGVKSGSINLVNILGDRGKLITTGAGNLTLSACPTREILITASSQVVVYSDDSIDMISPSLLWNGIPLYGTGGTIPPASISAGSMNNVNLLGDRGKLIISGSGLVGFSEYYPLLLSACPSYDIQLNSGCSILLTSTASKIILEATALTLNGSQVYKKDDSVIFNTGSFTNLTSGSITSLGTIVSTGSMYSASKITSSSIVARWSISGSTITGSTITGSVINASRIIAESITTTGCIVAGSSITAHGFVTGGSLVASGCVRAQSVIASASVIAGGSIVGLNIIGYSSIATNGLLSAAYISTTGSITASGSINAPSVETDIVSSIYINTRYLRNNPDISDDVSLTTVGNVTVNPSGSYLYPDNNYDTNLGMLNKKWLTIHGAELWVETLVAQNTMATIGGRVIIAPTTTLTRDLLVAGSAIFVKHNQISSGDRVYLESNGKLEWIAVTTSPSLVGTDEYMYYVTRNLDGTGANEWYAGDAVLNTGAAGDGYIDLYSINSISSSTTQFGPTITGNVRNSGTFNDISEAWAIGNLNGLYGVGTDTYGAGFGKYADEQSFIVIEPGNGIRMQYRDGSGYVYSNAQWYNSGSMRIGELGTGHIIIDTGSVVFYNSDKELAKLSGTTWTLGDTVGEHVYIDNGKMQIANGTDVAFGATSAGSVVVGNQSRGQYVDISDSGINLYGNNIRNLGITSAGSLVIGNQDGGEYLDISDSGINLYGNNIKNLALTSAGSLVIGNQSGGEYIDVSSTGMYFYSKGIKNLELASSGAVLVGDNLSNNSGWISMASAGHIYMNFRNNSGVAHVNGIWQNDGTILIGEFYSGSMSVIINNAGVSLYDGTQFRLTLAGDGIKMRNSSGIDTLFAQSDGDFFIGSNLSAATSTFVSIFSNNQTYNSESVLAGDVLLGDNSSNKPNMFWDKADGTLLFRTGTTSNMTLSSGSIRIGAPTQDYALFTSDSFYFRNQADVNVFSISGGADPEVRLGLPSTVKINEYGLRLDCVGTINPKLIFDDSLTPDDNGIFYLAAGTGATGEYNSLIAMPAFTGDASSFNTMELRAYAPTGGTAYDAQIILHGNYTSTNSYVYIGVGGSNRLKATSAALVINEDSLDCDFRVESNNNSNMLVVDAGLDSVGIGGAGVSGHGLALTGALLIKDNSSTPTYNSSGGVLYHKYSKLRLKDEYDFEHVLGGNSSAALLSPLMSYNLMALWRPTYPGATGGLDLGRWGYNLTANNINTQNIKGGPDGYYESANCNGTNGYWSVAATGNLPTYNWFTFGMWVKFDTNGRNHGLMCMGDSTVSWWVLYWNASNIFEFGYYQSDGTARTVSIANTITANQWYFIGGTHGWANSGAYNLQLRVNDSYTAKDQTSDPGWAQARGPAGNFTLGFSSRSGVYLDGDIFTAWLSGYSNSFCTQYYVDTYGLFHW